MSLSQSMQPESYQRQLGRSLIVYGSTFFHVILLSLLISIIAFIPRLASIYSGDVYFANNLAIDNPQRLWLILIDLINLIFFTAMFWRIRCSITGTRDTLFTDIKMAVKKFPYILVAGILQNIIFGLCVIAFYIGAYYWISYGQHTFNPNSLSNDLVLTFVFLAPFVCFLYVYFEFYFYLPLILIENKGVLSALKKSVSLVWGNWWRVVCLQLTPWLTYLLCLLIIKYGLNINIHIYFTHSTDPNTLLTTCFHIILFAIFLPWVAATLLVQLRNLEVIKQKFF